MRSWRKWLTVLAGCGAVFLVGTVRAESPPADTATAIQAIQQAPDPSAVVAAFANGTAVDRNSPKLYDAYVARMVDLGLPEMAYHQAQTLTTLQSDNGLAWGVVAFVDARRGQMPEAMAAINVAGQAAPDNKFVAHTAGELAAWYDFKADKTTVPDNTRNGFIKVRAILAQQATFKDAYANAEKAYQAQTEPAQPAPTQTSPGTAPQYAPTQQVPPASQVPMAPSADTGQPVAPDTYAGPAAYPDSSYYPAYYGWGPGWYSPSPWWWWWPSGWWWGGTVFVSFGNACCFNCHGFHHDGHFHDGHFHNDNFNNKGNNFHQGGMAHSGGRGQNNFVGSPARPSTSVAQAAAARGTGSLGRTTASSSGGSSHWWTGGGSAGNVSSARPAQPSIAQNQFGASANASRFNTASASMAHMGNGSLSTVQSGRFPSSAQAGRGSFNPGFTSTQRGIMSAQGGTMAAQRGTMPSAGSFNNFRATQTFRTPSFSMPRPTGGGSAGWYHQAQSSGGAWRGGGMAMSSVPRSSVGGSFGGFSGFHGGGMPAGGGGFHGGGASMGGGGFHGGGGGGMGGGGGGHR
jgi:hypothetical protein